MAVAPDSSLAGYSDLQVSTVAPRQASIDSTLVLPEHRGHRLGLGMKVLLHQRLHAEFPATELVVTDNADVNAPMIAVNQQLGYRIVDRCLVLQKALA